MHIGHWQKNLNCQFWLDLSCQGTKTKKKSLAYFSNLRCNVLQGKLSELKVHAALCRNSCQKFRGQGGCMNFTVFFPNRCAS